MYHMHTISKPLDGPEMLMATSADDATKDSTFRKIYTRDRRGAPMADRLKVWREYLRQVEWEVMRSSSVGRLPATNYEAMKPSPQASRKAAFVAVELHAFCESLRRMGRSRLPQLDSQVAECWLFHGTSFDAAAGIAENDFRLDLTGTNAGTLYGKGIYLAENVSKSDEYGEGPRGPKEEEQLRPPPGSAVAPVVRQSVLLVCRSLLGKVLYCDAEKPSPDTIQRSCLGKDRMLLTTPSWVYPEFIVVYERIFFHERFQEIFGQMVERCRRRQFNGPTNEEEKVLKSLWDRYAMPHQGRIDKWQLLDLLKAINQPPEDEEGDLVATFQEINTSGSGRINWEVPVAAAAEKR
eukprot:symbB.v1.2.010788.t1/scaffold707.1/size170859/9